MGAGPQHPLPPPWVSAWAPAEGRAARAGHTETQGLVQEPLGTAGEGPVSLTFTLVPILLGRPCVVSRAVSPADGKMPRLPRPGRPPAWSGPPSPLAPGQGTQPRPPHCRARNSRCAPTLPPGRGCGRACPRPGWEQVQLRAWPGRPAVPCRVTPDHPRIFWPAVSPTEWVQLCHWKVRGHGDQYRLSTKAQRSLTWHLSFWARVSPICCLFLPGHSPPPCGDVTCGLRRAGPAGGPGPAGDLVNQRG